MTRNPLIQALKTVALLITWTFLQTGPGLAQSKPLLLFHGVHPAMGSEFTINLYAPDSETAQQWMQISFDEIDRIEALLSNYRPSSELSRISREASLHPVTTDPETFAFLRTSFDWSRRSGGAFDITVGPLMRAWGFFFNHGRIPSQIELETLSKQTGWQNVDLVPASRTVYFIDHANLELDPGGIGKGYAVDRIVGLLHQQHVTAALISAGTSTIYAVGKPPGSAGWVVHIPDPAHDGKILTTVALTDTSLSTSGCTEKFFIKDGHRYCHILDPRTMRPVENMLQTTIIAPSATDSDALSTATFVMGPEASARLLRSCPHSEAVFVAGTPQAPRYSSVSWPDPLAINKEAVPGKGN